jgi:septum formation protein
VRFAELTDAQIQSYIETKEPFGKAGAYGIQGGASAFIPEIKGSYSGIMGLPLYETALLLDRAQVQRI